MPISSRPSWDAGLEAFNATYAANSSLIIAPYLFDAPDASAHIFEFLTDPIYRGFLGDDTGAGQVLNWTEYCSSAGNIVLAYGPFLGCLLYPNTTLNVRDGSLPANLSGLGFAPVSNSTALYVRSTIATCLPVYCASQSECAATDVCSVGNLLTGGYELSARGVAECWQTLCSEEVETVNPDIAGGGILISYLVQVSIVVLGLGALAVLATEVYRSNGRASAASLPSDSESSSSAEHGKTSQRTVKDHYIIVNLFLADFHKAQCFLAIALQVGALVRDFSEFSSTNYLDQNFLLLVSLTGLVPVIVALYALMTFGQKSWYMISLSTITVALASTIGAYVSLYVLSPNSNTTVLEGGSLLWPAACEGTGPSAICSGIGVNDVYFDNDSRSFLAVMAVMDIVLGLLILWKIATESTTLWEKGTAWLAARLLGRHKLLPGLQKAQHDRNVRLVRQTASILLHSVVVLVLLATVAAEYYYFWDIFSGPFLDFSSWGFGQIVGLTTWTGSLADLVYLECMGVGEGLEWRFPKWLQVKQVTREPEPAVLSLTRRLAPPTSAASSSEKSAAAITDTKAACIQATQPTAPKAQDRSGTLNLAVHPPVPNNGTRRRWTEPPKLPP